MCSKNYCWTGTKITYINFLRYVHRITVGQVQKITYINFLIRVHRITVGQVQKITYINFLRCVHRIIVGQVQKITYILTETVSKQGRSTFPRISGHNFYHNHLKTGDPSVKHVLQELFQKYRTVKSGVTLYITQHLWKYSKVTVPV